MNCANLLNGFGFCKYDAKGYFFQSLRLVKASLRAERVLRRFLLRHEYTHFYRV